MLNNVTVTGAAGFLGREIVARLYDEGYRVRAIVRSTVDIYGASDIVAVRDIQSADANDMVAGSDAVINCAARVHVLRPKKNFHEKEAFQAMNCDLPVKLAMAAKHAGVRRFVQISSVAALQSLSEPGEIIGDSTKPAPASLYGASKLAADNLLQKLSGNGFTTVSLRPPAIFGRSSRGWFNLLAAAAKLGLPLPIGRISNRRSFAFVGNIADAAVIALESACTGQYIVTDSEPISTAALYRELLHLQGKGERIWSWPPMVIEGLAKPVLGRRASSFLGDAAYDGRRFSKDFAWQPRYSLKEGLRMSFDPVVK